MKNCLCSLLCGVLQGPTLFLIFSNDSPEILKSFDAIQFADDTVIFVSAKDVYSFNVSSLARLKSFRPS